MLFLVRLEIKRASLNHHHQESNQSEFEEIELSQQQQQPQQHVSSQQQQQDREPKQTSFGFPTQNSPGKFGGAFSDIPGTSSTSSTRLGGSHFPGLQRNNNPFGTGQLPNNLGFRNPFGGANNQNIFNQNNFASVTRQGTLGSSFNALGGQ